MLGLAVASAPAEASAPSAEPARGTFVSTVQCSAGGFQGMLRITKSMVSGPGTVYRIEYRILKNGQSGGNKANVSWWDYGTAPATTAHTGDTGKQDGNWHTLREADYHRGSGSDSYRFIFDKSSAGDPQCSEYGPL